MDVEELDKEKVVKELQPTSEQKTQLENLAEKNVEEIKGVDLDSLQERRNIASMIENFGSQDVALSAEKNKMLEKTLGELSKTGSEGSKISNTLAELNREMKELDPSGVNFNDKGIFGKMFNPVKNYFQKYEKADEQINGIIESLEAGRKTLLADNTTLEIEQASLRNLTKKIGKQVELGMAMDADLEKAIEQARVNNEDPEKIKFIQEECLFPLRQKVMDLQQMQAVNQQGYFAMEIVRRNNKELIRAVERAKNVTVSALRTAVTVASALYNQKLVLDKVNLINETTNNLIRGTSIMLKEQGAEIQQKAMNTNISVETLKEAFQNTFEALDQVEEYKLKALPQMKQSIADFRALADQGEARLQRMDRTESYRKELSQTTTLPKLPDVD